MNGSYSQYETIEQTIKGHTNPVVFEISPDYWPYVVLAETLDEYCYRDRIVGFTAFNFFVCTRRIARSGYYEMVAKPIPWSEADEVYLSRSFSLGRIVIGFVAFVLGLCLLGADLDNSVESVLGYWDGLLALVGGSLMAFSGRTVRLTIWSSGTKYIWHATYGKDDRELREILCEIPATGIDPPPE